MLLHGKCHCANIAFELAWDGDPPEIPARACDCSFCTRHGGVWTSNPKSTLAVTLRDASLVSKYAFGSHTATFLVCSRCGTVPLVTSEIADHLYAVVNVNALEKYRPGVASTHRRVRGRRRRIAAARKAAQLDSRCSHFRRSAG